MSRSIHVTQRDLRRERRFAMSDDVPAVPGWTHLQAADIQKALYKLNVQRRRQAAQMQGPRHVHLALAPHKSGPERFVDTLLRNRHYNPNRLA